MKLREILCGLALLGATCGVAVRAQGQNPNPQPAGSAAYNSSTSPAGLGGNYAQRPAAAARGVSSPDSSVPYDPSQVIPDTNTLAGAQLFGVGSLGRAHNIFDLSLSVSELGQTYPSTAGQTNQSNLSSTSIASGGLNFNRTWDRYHFSANYSGGETFIQGYEYLNTPFHDLTVMQEISWARWHLLLRDDFIASPGAAFTGTGMGGPGLIGQLPTTSVSSLGGIGQGIAPGETIQTGNAMRYQNSAVGQLEYSFSRRSAFTVSGSYGLLQFSTAGYFSSHMLNAQAGYDFMLDPADSIALIANYGKIDYSGTSDSTSTYTAALAYGRKITGRWAFQVEAGPAQIHNAIGASAYQIWYASVNSALTYQGRRAGYSLSFMRGLGSGSGVVQGAENNTLTLAAHYQFSRHWTGSFHGGYAINNSLSIAGSPTVRFDNWFVGAGIGRQLWSHALFTFSYGAQRQNGPAVCPVGVVGGCGVNGLQQTFGMTVNWHLRPNG
jgi:hypothetical protein